MAVENWQDFDPKQPIRDQFRALPADMLGSMISQAGDYARAHPDECPSVMFSSPSRFLCPLLVEPQDAIYNGINHQTQLWDAPFENGDYVTSNPLLVRALREHPLCVGTLSQYRGELDKVRAGTFVENDRDEIKRQEQVDRKNIAAVRDLREVAPWAYNADGILDPQLLAAGQPTKAKRKAAATAE